MLATKDNTVFSGKSLEVVPIFFLDIVKFISWIPLQFSILDAITTPACVVQTSQATGTFACDN